MGAKRQRVKAELPAEGTLWGGTWASQARLNLVPHQRSSLTRKEVMRCRPSENEKRFCGVLWPCEGTIEAVGVGADGVAFGVTLPFAIEHSDESVDRVTEGKCRNQTERGKNSKKNPDGC